MSDLVEEKALEEAIRDNAPNQLYLEAFRKAREAFWQRGGESITQCDERCVDVLREYFILRDEAAARITELEAENARLREVAGRCATIVDRYLYRQHEKVEDVPKLLRAALGEQGVG